ncbi:MAG: D-Ala-D-Ala carboxypeptidase family metallohydrolase [Verrucomicrobiales bacterium]
MYTNNSSRRLHEAPSLKNTLSATSLPSANPLQRRRFLSNLTLSGLGMLAGCSSSAFGSDELDELVNAVNNCSDDPQECLEEIMGELGKTESALREKLESKLEAASPTKPKIKFRFLKGELVYANFIDNLNLRHIKPHEVLRPHRNTQKGVKNSLPPQSMWKEIAYTLRVADEIRERLGKPLVYINSAYRSPEYNAACAGSASRSYHMKNCALDLVFEGGPGAAVGMAKKLRGEKFFKGGIGGYSSFVHVDTRGSNATWEA